MKIRFNTPENKIPDYDRGLRIPYGEAKRTKKPWRWYLILIISSLPLLYLIGLIITENVFIEARGRITVPQLTVRSSGDEYIQQIYVKPLQTVTKGMKLALLSNSALEKNYRNIKNEINFLENEKSALSIQTLNSKQLIAFATEQKNFYQNRLRQYETLFLQGAATQAEIATARSQFNSALENLVVQQSAQHQQRQNQETQSEIRQITIRINQLTSELKQIKQQKEELLIKSPEDGLITEIFVQPGEFLAKGQSLLDIIFLEKAYISAYIPPKYQTYVKVGTVVTVIFPNGESVKARITFVPGITTKDKIEDTGIFESPRSAILVYMEFIEPVKSQLINGIPLNIRFHHFPLN